MSITLIITILVVVALLLFAIEAFVTPGIGAAGIAASVLVIIADIMVYFQYGWVAAVGALIASTAVVCLFFWIFSKSKTIDRLSLHSTIDSTSATQAQLSVKPGDKGVATTRLALIGNADFDGRTVEVKSAGEFIEEGTPIVVTSVNEALIIVKAL